MKINTSVHYDTENIIEVDIFSREGCLAIELFSDLFDALDFIESYRVHGDYLRIDIMIGGFVTFTYERGDLGTDD